MKTLILALALVFGAGSFASAENYFPPRFEKVYRQDKPEVKKEIRKKERRQDRKIARRTARRVERRHEKRGK